MLVVYPNEGDLNARISAGKVQLERALANRKLTAAGPIIAQPFVHLHEAPPDADALRDTVRHLRVRIATGGRLTVAGGPGATDGGSDSLDRAELEAAELARARRELEDRTAELVRLKGVLRGELLRRVLEDAETTRTSLGRLDVATDD